MNNTNSPKELNRRILLYVDYCVENSPIKTSLISFLIPLLLNSERAFTLFMRPSVNEFDTFFNISKAFPCENNRERFTALVDDKEKIIEQTVFSCYEKVSLYVKVTALQKTVYPDLIANYENPIEHPCSLSIGDSFITNRWWEIPVGFCDSAWQSIFPFLKALSLGEGNFYDGWMKNPLSALISCNDGFRPISFLLEVIPHD